MLWEGAAGGGIEWEGFGVRKGKGYDYCYVCEMKEKEGT